MRAGSLRVSTLSIVVACALGAVALLVFFQAREGAEHQNGLLLRDETTQASVIATSTFDGYTSQVGGPLATAAVLDPGALQTTASVVAEAGRSVHLVIDVFRRSGAAFSAVAAAGPGQTVGEGAPPSLAPTLLAAQSATTPQLALLPQYVPAPARHRGSSTTLGFAQAVTQGSATIVYFGFTVNPYTWASTLVRSGGPFEQLRAVLYASHDARPSSVAVATTRQLPLTGTSARALVSVGTGSWLLVTQARSPLAGTWATTAPWLILGLGLFLAVALAATVEVLVRRQRYAELVAAQRATELLEAQQALLRQERLSAIGQMAAMIGHELRNPLAAIVNTTFVVRERAATGDPELAGQLDVIEREAERAAKLSEDLTVYARERNPAVSDIDLRQLLSEVLDTCPSPGGIAVEIEEPLAPLRADRGELVQILTNLVTNSYQAMPQGGSLHLSAVRNNGFVDVRVEDSGGGIDSSIADKVFEPFFTTKMTGTGLGLAIVKRLVDAHSGRVSIEHVVGGGCRVVVSLPDS